MRYALVTEGGETIAAFAGYPEALVAAPALAAIGPLAIEGPGGPGEFRSAAAWAAEVELMRALFAPAEEVAR